MKRIIFLVIRLLYRIPGWLLTIHRYNKHKEDVSFETRFDFTQRLIRKVNEKSRVNIHCFGKENLPEEQGYLMAPNHQGLFDALILFGTHDQPFKFIVKKELMHVFVLKNVLHMVDALAIDRENIRASVKVIRQASKDMAAGTSYVIFPEGTRCRQQNKMLEFKGGTFKSVMDAKKPIVPVALIDCYKVFDNNSIEKVDAQIHYLPPIYYDEYKDMNSTEVASMVQSRVEKCIQENENKF